MSRKIVKVGKNLFIVDEYHSDGTFYQNRGVFRTLEEARGKV